MSDVNLIDGDYVLTDGAAWFRVKNFSIRIQSTDEGVVVDLGKVVDGFGLGWVVMYSCARVIWFCMSLSMVVDPCVWTCVALTEPGWSPGGLAPMSKSILK